MIETAQERLQEKLKPYPRVALFGLEFLKATEAQCVELIVDSALAGVGGWVVTPNLDILRKCVHEPDIFQITSDADVRVADGMPLIWASRIQKTPLPERVSGSNLVRPLVESCANNGLRVFLLGGAPGVVQRTRKRLQIDYPKLEIVGVHCPPFGFESDAEEMQRIRTAVETQQPDIVFVALSFPKGEKLIEWLRPNLPNVWWIGVGITFSFLSGDIRRAPLWMQKSGMEWLFRLYQEPRRLAYRYFVHDFPFAFRLFASALYNRFRR